MTPQPADAPPNYYFSGGGESFVSMPALCFFLICCILIVSVPRKHIVTAFLIPALLLPLGNVVVIGGLHWMLYRLLLFVGLIRVGWQLVVGHVGPMTNRWNALDKALVLWALSNAIMYTLTWGPEAIINRLGFLYTTLGCYFLMRHLVRDSEDVTRTIISLSIVCLVVAPFMVVERFTQANYFLSLFQGGSPFPELRDGKLRAQGPFAHPSIAGTFAAALLPLFIGLWRRRKAYRAWATLGAIATVAMTITSNSSTPVLTLIAGCAALSFWPFRRYIRHLRWASVLLLLVLQLVMKADVWFLIARAGSLGGGSAWHRAELVNQAIRHFGDWWLTGTRSNSSWGPAMWDVDNAYVGAAFSGGLLTLGLFVSVLAYGYKGIGQSRKHAQGSRDDWFLWALGSALFANTAAFFGIVYFDQSINAWYAFLALIPVLHSRFLETVRPEHIRHSLEPASEEVEKAWMNLSCLSLRPYTLVGASPAAIEEAAFRINQRPFGRVRGPEKWDGQAGKRIVNMLLNNSPARRNLVGGAACSL